MYRTIWRWHFYAGLFCIPFILAMSISGAIYLFKPQIDSWLDAPYHNLAINDGEYKSANQHIAAALAAVPNGKFKAYALPARENDAAVVSLSSEQERLRVYVHPADLSILAIRNPHHEFVQQVKHFHGELLVGNAGSILVELAACWAIVLILSGVYLWWPRSVSGLGGILYPRLRHGSRRLWRDLHAVSGFWVAIFALFLLISGLPWALVWGSAFKEIRQIGNPSAMTQGENPGKQRQSQKADWNISSEHEHSEHRSGKASSAKNINLTEDVLLAAKQLQFVLPAELSLSDGKENIWLLSSLTQNRPLRADAWIDANDGQVIKTQGFSDKNTVDRVIGYGIAAHEGQLFGWFNQLLGLLTAIALVTLASTGFVLWRKRKPKGALGAPTEKYSPKAARTVLGIVFVLAIFLPMLLLSLILILLIERYVLKFFPRISLWLGIAHAKHS